MPKSRRGEDPIAVVEAAYDLRLGPQAWLAGVLRAAAPDLDRNHGVFACCYELTAGDQIVFEDPIDEVRAAADGFVEQYVRSRQALDPSLVRRLYRFGPLAATLGDLVEWGFLAADEADAERQFLKTHGFVDLLAVRVHDADAGHCLLAAPMSRASRTPPAYAERWERLATHIAAGARLRKNLQHSDPIQGAEAVFDPDGVVRHAAGEVSSRSAQERLRAAIQAVELARSRRQLGDEALKLWKGLIDGKWSLVDSFDNAGRRYVVARRNDPHIRDPRALTPRERQVAALLAQGHSDKLIAYELGLSGSTVHQYVRSIVSKLGAGSRVTLVTLLRQLHADRLEFDDKD